MSVTKNSAKIFDMCDIMYNLSRMIESIKRFFLNVIRKIKSIVFNHKPDKKLYGKMVIKFDELHFYVAYDILYNLDGVYLVMCDAAHKIVTIEYDRSLIACCSQIHNVLKSKNIKYEVIKDKNHKHYCDNHSKCE